jgi:hypothetical protein
LDPEEQAAIANAAETSIAATKALCVRRRRKPASAVRFLDIVHLRGNRLMAFSLALLALRSGNKL